MKTRKSGSSFVRRSAFLLFLSMLLAVFAVFPSYATTIEDATVTENTATRAN